MESRGYEYSKECALDSGGLKFVSQPPLPMVIIGRDFIEFVQIEEEVLQMVIKNQLEKEP